MDIGDLRKIRPSEIKYFNKCIKALWCKGCRRCTCSQISYFLEDDIFLEVKTKKPFWYLKLVNFIVMVLGILLNPVLILPILQISNRICNFTQKIGQESYKYLIKYHHGYQIWMLPMTLSFSICISSHTFMQDMCIISGLIGFWDGRYAILFLVCWRCAGDWDFAFLLLITLLCKTCV